MNFLITLIFVLLELGSIITTTKVLYIPEIKRPDIFDQYSFPKLNNQGRLTDDQRENIVRLLMWRDWWRYFCNFPPIWEIPDCIPPSISESLFKDESAQIQTLEYWDKKRKYYHDQVNLTEYFILNNSKAMGTVLTGSAVLLRMHHYSKELAKKIKGKEDDDPISKCDSSKRPLYYGHAYGVRAPIIWFSKDFQVPYKMSLRNSNKRSKELPTSCFCNQYFWNGCLH